MQKYQNACHRHKVALRIVGTTLLNYICFKKKHKRMSIPGYRKYLQDQQQQREMQKQWEAQQLQQQQEQAQEQKYQNQQYIQQQLQVQRETQNQQQYQQNQSPSKRSFRNHSSNNLKSSNSRSMTNIKQNLQSNRDQNDPMQCNTYEEYKQLSSQRQMSSPALSPKKRCQQNNDQQGLSQKTTATSRQTQRQFTQRDIDQFIEKMDQNAQQSKLRKQDQENDYEDQKMHEVTGKPQTNKKSMKMNKENSYNNKKVEVRMMEHQNKVKEKIEEMKIQQEEIENEEIEKTCPFKPKNDIQQQYDYDEFFQDQIKWQEQRDRKIKEKHFEQQQKKELQYIKEQEEFEQKQEKKESFQFQSPEKQKYTEVKRVEDRLIATKYMQEQNLARLEQKYTHSHRPLISPQKSQRKINQNQNSQSVMTQQYGSNSSQQFFSPKKFNKSQSCKSYTEFKMQKISMIEQQQQYQQNNNEIHLF